MIPDDYVHVDDCVKVAIENGWLSVKEIYNYIIINLGYVIYARCGRTGKFTDAEKEDIEYLEKLKELVNKIDFVLLRKIIVAESL